MSRVPVKNCIRQRCTQAITNPEKWFDSKDTDAGCCNKTR